MSTRSLEVDLSGIDDPQRLLAFVFGVVLFAVGVAGLSGVFDFELQAVPFGPGLVFGLFGVPLWLGVTAIVAGLIGIVLASYAGAGTTFNKVAAGLVFPPVAFLAITDWALASGSTAALALGGVTLLLAVVFVAVWVVLFYKTVLMPVHPVVAVLAIADWGLDLSAMAPASEPVNLPTIGLLLVLAVVVGVVGFEGGARLT